MINVPNASVSSTANGGAGGVVGSVGCGFSCVGGSGGSANAQASGIARDQATVSAIATGGDAGPGSVSAGAGANGGSATLSSGGLGPAVFGSSATGGTVTVSGTAIGGAGGSTIDTNVNGNGASVSLISNGGVNDAIGGATSGTLNLTQTAIGGNAVVARAALVVVHQAHLLELTPTEPQPIILMPMQLAGMAAELEVAQPQRLTRVLPIVGIANATANAKGGDGNLFGNGFGFGGNATAIASATNGGSAVAQATGGQRLCGGPALATATSTAMLGGTANATATATGEGVGAFWNFAGANANSSATTINGNAAQAKSFATGSSRGGGQAQATAQTNFGNFTSVQSTSTSPVSQPGTPASAIAQAGGVVSPSNAIIAGQSFSVVSGSGFGPLTVANGSMGAGYGGTSSVGHLSGKR